MQITELTKIICDDYPRVWEKIMEKNNADNKTV